jgi:acetyl esterase/lipase
MKRIPPAIAILAAIIIALLLVPAVVRRWPEITGAVRTGIAYGPDPSQVLDVCAPRRPSSGARPALMMVHGGTWRSGGRKDWFEACRRAAKAGVVGIEIDYRLVDGTANHAWPAQLVDAQLAMRWIRAHAGDYGIDPDHVCAIGDSAGGQLAVFLAALDKPAQADFADRLPGISPQANCAVDWFGPVDLSGFLQRWGPAQSMFAGVTPANYAEAERGASPLFAVGPRTAPILIAHGTEDRIVPIRQSEALRDALTREGVPNRLQVFRGGHEFADDDGERPAYTDAAIGFTKDPAGFLKNTRPPGAD